MNIANVTAIAEDVGLDLSQSRDSALSYLESKRTEIINEYGPRYYDSIYDGTVAYYSNNNALSNVLRPPTNSVDQSAAISSGFTAFVDPERAEMRKISNEELGLTEEREIRPSYTKRIPNERPFLIQMVDRNMRSYGIGLPNGTVVTALKLTPNPNSLTINSSKIINRYNTMTRWVEEHWGDEIDNLNFSGSTFSFFAYNVIGIPDAGLTLKYRNQTKPYELMREITKFFKINGLIYQDEKSYEGRNIPIKGHLSPTDTFLNDPSNARFLYNHPRTGLVKERLYINLWYDYVSFIGFFETFDVIEESGNPFKFNYNAVFKAEKTKFHQGNTATLRA